MDDKQDWYNNKDLYEMMVNISKRMEVVSSELSKTQVLIRDYNGLREKLNSCEQRVDHLYGSGKGSKDTWGYIVGGIGLIMALISYATR